MTARSRMERPSEEPKYAPTERERTAISRFRNAHAERGPRVKISRQGETPQIALEHPEETIGYALLMDAMGTANIDFVQDILSQLANASSQRGEIDERGLNFMLSVIKDIKPRSG